MKALFSSPVCKLSIWMTVGMLGASLLSLPMTAVAQEAASNSTNVDAAHYSSHRKIYVRYTSWQVEPARSGRRHDYAPLPWVFSPDGTVHSGDLWSGHWHYLEKGKVRVSLTMNDGSRDQFIVKFTSPYEFTAYKNGSPYRYGVRQ
jgi:hypothetical protein